MSACAIAFGAVSARGVGRAAFSVGDPGDRPRVAIARDEELARGGLARPFAARVGLPAGAGDRATDLLLHALRDAIAGLDVVRPGFRAERIGLVLGTSSGAMPTAERAFAERRAGGAGRLDAGTYFAPFDAARAAVAAPLAREAQVLAACAASTLAIGLGLRWLDLDDCDLVLAGGYDAVTTFVAAGFEVLRATSATTPRPFRVGRDGMALGDGAGVVALVRTEDARGAPATMRVAGFGASTDAVHITAPDRTGAGLARAARAALADAGIDGDAIDLVSAHATATPFNDAMESRALASVSASRAVVHPFKAEIGHTLGAAGVLEALAAADALARGVAPAAAGDGDLDPDAPALLLPVAEARDLGAALKLSAAFGGSNAALVLTREAAARPRRAARDVFLVDAVHVAAVPTAAEVADLAGLALDRVGRLEALRRLALAAVGKLARLVTLEGAGVVAGHALATIDVNERFDAGLHARRADPRVFPATSPNAVAGECAIAFHLTGPGLSVGAGLDGGTEALVVARDLVAAGDADRVVVVVADDAGPAARAAVTQLRGQDADLRAGAVALLVAASGSRPVPRALAPDHARGAIGHLALISRGFVTSSEASPP